MVVGLLTKYKPDQFVKCCIVPGDEGRAMLKATVTIAGQPISFILVIWIIYITNVSCLVDIVV